MARLGCRTVIHRQGGSRHHGRFLPSRSAREPRCEALHLPRTGALGQVRVTLISADWLERTMVTHLGAACWNSAEEIRQSDLRRLHFHRGISGAGHELILKAARTPRKCGAGGGHRPQPGFSIVAGASTFLRGELVREDTSIVFANEGRGQETSRARPNRCRRLGVISRDSRVAVVNRHEGRFPSKRGDEVRHVGIMAAAKRVIPPVRATSAPPVPLGLLPRGLTLRQCGTIGAITAGKVIEVVGDDLRRGGLAGYLPAGEQGQAREVPLLAPSEGTG